LVLPNTAVLVTWSAPDAMTCRGVAGLSGTLPTSGSQTSAPLSETTSFAIECSNPSGLVADATVVTVMKFTALELPIQRAVDLNDHGEVLGYRTSVGDRLEPVVWLAGGRNIVVLGCSDPVPYYCRSHYPVAMNSNPTVVGRQYSLSGMTWEGFRWYVADTVVYPVAISFPENITDINDAGQIVGGGPGPGAALISDGTKVLLFGSNGSNSMASAINNAGHVTGYVVPGADGIRHVFLYADGTTQDLGTMDGASSDAQDINLTDEIAGLATFPAGSRAFRYSNSSFMDLGSLGGASSAALGINDAGRIVGWSLLTGEVPQRTHAFLYVNDTMYDLNDLVDPLPVTLRSASKINNRGQVLAYGCVPPADDNCRYYLLTPVSPF
jgi:probable HAF family extracellular repeat protein